MSEHHLNFLNDRDPWKLVDQEETGKKKQFDIFFCFLFPVSDHPAWSRRPENYARVTRAYQSMWYSLVVLLFLDKQRKRRSESLIQHCRVLYLARGRKFLREFIFRALHFFFFFFCVLRELIFAIRTDWFFLLRINFFDFQKVPSTQHW